MANNYMTFSEEIRGLTPEEKKWIKDIPDRGDFAQDPKYEGETWLKAFGAALIDYGLDITGIENTLEDFPDFDYKIDVRGNWWMYADEYANLDHIACIVQAFIKKFRPDFIFTLTWADTCSKLRVGEFSGGCMVVSKDAVVSRSACILVDRIAKALRMGGSFKT